MGYEVILTYFMDNGKFYCEGKGTTNKRQLSQIWEQWEYRIRAKKERPGFLYYNRNTFSVVINVPEHRHNKPFLIKDIPHNKRRLYAKRTT